MPILCRRMRELRQFGDAKIPVTYPKALEVEAPTVLVPTEFSQTERSALTNAQRKQSHPLKTCPRRVQHTCGLVQKCLCT